MTSKLDYAWNSAVSKRNSSIKTYRTSPDIHMQCKVSSFSGHQEQYLFAEYFITDISIQYVRK